LGHFFIVRTDHKALKFLIDQQVGTVAQQRWLSKLLDYNFVIEFKKGKDNSVADALSRQSNGFTKEELSIALIFFPTPTRISDLKESYLSDQHTTELLTALQRGDSVLKGYSLQQGPILRKGRLWVVKDSPFQQQLLTFIHSNPTSGHSGYHKTIQRVKTNFPRKVCAMILRNSCVSALFAKKINMSPCYWLGCSNHYPHPLGSGQI
jgi:hypothetical protein